MQRLSGIYEASEDAEPVTQEEWDTLIESLDTDDFLPPIIKQLAAQELALVPVDGHVSRFFIGGIYDEEFRWDTNVVDGKFTSYFLSYYRDVVDIS